MPVSHGIPCAAAVTTSNIEKVVRTEGELAAVMVLERLGYRQELGE